MNETYVISRRESAVGSSDLPACILQTLKSLLDAPVSLCPGEEAQDIYRRRNFMNQVSVCVKVSVSWLVAKTCIPM